MSANEPLPRNTDQVEENDIPGTREELVAHLRSAPHTLHCRFGLDSTKRVSQYLGGEGTEVEMYGVQSAPFGPATPSANLRMRLIGEAAQEMPRNAPLGQVYEVVFFPVKPKPQHEVEVLAEEVTADRPYGFTQSLPPGW